MGLSPREDVAPVIRLRVLINKELDEVWQRFLDPLTMIQWLGDEISADIRSGGHITFLGNGAPTTSEMGNRWDIKELTERKGILFGWNILGSDSLFVLRFRAINGGTYLE
ncbi:MAG: SRPBCC domain-containing protein, partial [Candidatus Sifarchaeia archaeon]